jgi:WD40 repeat protein
MGTDNDGVSRNTRTKVFLSYSRHDEEFIDRLQHFLYSRDYDPVFDRSAIPQLESDLRLTAQDEWWKQLKRMIAGSDVMVFVVSPNSAESTVCNDEITLANRLGKRIIPILRSSIDFSRAPEQLRALNVILDFQSDDADEFAGSMNSLCLELDKDIAWDREFTHISRIALMWDESGRPEGQLLRAGVISKIDALLIRPPANAPAPGDIFLAFLDASRAKEIADRNKLRLITGRAFVKPAEQACEEGRFDEAIRLATAGAILAEDEEMTLVPELLEPLFTAATATSIRAIIQTSSRRVSFCPKTIEEASILATECGEVWNATSGQLLWEPNRNGRRIECTCFSPNGMMLLGGSSDSCAYIWMVATGESKAILTGHSRAVTAVAFSPDSAKVATRSQDGSVRVWDVESATCTQIMEGHDHLMPQISFNHNGTALIATTGKKVTVWDVSTGESLAVLGGHTDIVHRAVYSPDGELVATVSNDNTARIWKTSDWHPIACLPHDGWVVDLCFHPDGSRLATACVDGTARIWSLPDSTHLATLRGHIGQLFCISYSPTGLLATGGLDQCVRIWNDLTGEGLHVLRGHASEVRSVAFNSEGTRLASTAPQDHLRIWDPAPSPEALVIRGHREHVRSVNYSQDGLRIVSTSGDGTARIWEPNSGQELLRVDDVSGNAVLSPDGQYIAVIGPRAHDAPGIPSLLRVLKSETGEELARIQGHYFAQIAFSPDGAMLAASTYGDEALLLESQTLGVHWTFPAGDSDGRCIAFSPDGQLLATASQRETLNLWSITTRQHIATLTGTLFTEHNFHIKKIRFLSSEHFLMSVSSGGIRIWDLQERCEVGAYRIEAIDACVDARLRLVAVACFDGTVRLVDMLRLQQIGILRIDLGESHIGPLDKYRGMLSGIDINSNGTVLAIAHADNTIRIWDMRRSMAIAGDVRSVVAAALARGVSLRSPNQEYDILMEYAPADLNAAFRDRLEPDVIASAQLIEQSLSEPFHPNCYRTDR